jgi:hypothetical protein
MHNQYMSGRHSDNINTQIVYTTTWEKFPRDVKTTLFIYYS